MTSNTSTTDELDKIVFETLGEASSLFMHSPKPGNQQIMPTAHLKKLGNKAKQALLALVNKAVIEARIDELKMLQEFKHLENDSFIQGRKEQLVKALKETS